MEIWGSSYELGHFSISTSRVTPYTEIRVEDVVELYLWRYVFYGRIQYNGVK
jgi:hypothetical protein